jgi:phage tail-like protein
MLPLPDNFRYLNREGHWLDFHWQGLARGEDGALQLLPSPRVVDPPPDLDGIAAPASPAGLAVDDSGRIFFSVPDDNKVFYYGGCSPVVIPLNGLPETAGLGPWRHPRGLLMLDNPRRLVVVDSGNHRLLFFDLVGFNLRAVWGQDDVAANPLPGSAPGKFSTPWTVSTDGDRNLYVLDYGNRRIQKFRETGEPDTQFAANLKQSKLVPHPSALAVWGKGAHANVFVFDLDAQAIYVFDGKGAPLRDSEGDVIAIRHAGMTRVLALAATADALYAGDNHLLRVLAFQRTPGYPFSGEAAGFEGPVAALGIAPPERLLISPGAGKQPLQLSTTGAYLPFGVLWSDAISSGNAPAVWNRLRAYVGNAEGAHIEFHYSVSNSATPPAVHPSTSDPFSDAAWTALPRDVEDFLLAGDKACFLFVGAIFRGDGTVTPSLTQLRADFDDPGYMPYLPAIYRQPPASADFVRRFLALFKGIFDDIEGAMDSLPHYFNPYSAPADSLPWLASWLAVDLDRGEPLLRIRTAIAHAFQRYQWRGTVEGLKLALLEDAGVHANIGSPIGNASFWGFAADTTCSGVPSTPNAVQLGVSTNLPDAEPGGAVLGATAQLDRSYLITDAEFGEPLFDGSAYQFVVEVYAGEVAAEGRLALVRSIVEREKPAHTMWRLSVIDPAMRAGFQARAGIDSIVGGTPASGRLGEAGSAGGVTLSGPPAPRVGASRLGQDLTLEQ